MNSSRVLDLISHTDLFDEVNLKKFIKSVGLILSKGNEPKYGRIRDFNIPIYLE